MTVKLSHLSMPTSKDAVACCACSVDSIILFGPEDLFRSASSDLLRSTVLTRFAPSASAKFASSPFSTIAFNEPFDSTDGICVNIIFSSDRVVTKSSTNEFPSSSSSVVSFSSASNLVVKACSLTSPFFINPRQLYPLIGLGSMVTLCSEFVNDGKYRLPPSSSRSFRITTGNGKGTGIFRSILPFFLVRCVVVVMVAEEETGTIGLSTVEVVAICVPTMRERSMPAHSYCITDWSSSNDSFNFFSLPFSSPAALSSSASLPSSFQLSISKISTAFSNRVASLEAENSRALTKQRKTLAASPTLDVSMYMLTACFFDSKVAVAV
mmetsp:Transcript_27893/g.52584  ORF Transcript_27893/g.52584 Transcript_27893/m.52584 type:complete len:324 (-) Transcript_27893:1193-2164(-)